MSTTDPFARYLDAVAASLDEDVSAEDLAGRIHYSRAYVDKVVKASTGEGPGRFRRRILLERAAFRLLTESSSVLDVAVEAGYASHEAFTRAFQRDYGAPPAQWRRAPTRPLLDAPNGVHFHPPGGLRVPAPRKLTSMDLVVTMTEHHISLIRRMIDNAAGVDPAVLDQPIELSVDGIDREPTLRSLLSRLVGQLQMWNRSVANQPYDFSVVGARRSRRTAKRAMSSASTSVKLCSASPTSASESASHPITSSATTNAAVAAEATISLSETLLPS